MPQQPDFTNALATIFVADPRFRILYLIPHPDQDLRLASPLQGATGGLISTAYLLEKSMSFLADVRELCSEWQHIALFRTMGLISHRVMPVEFSAFSKTTALEMWPPFRCVLSTEETFEFVSAGIAATAQDWLHLSTVPGDGRVDIDETTADDLLVYVRRRVDALREGPHSDLAKICSPLLTGKTPSGRALNLTAFRHNLTRPNELALQAFGCRLRTDGPPSPGSERRAVQWIVRSFDFVTRHRQKLVSSELHANAMILSVPGTFRGMKDRKVIGRMARHTLDPKASRHILRSLLRSKTYLKYFSERSIFERVHTDAGMGALTQMRSGELTLYTSLLVRLAAGALTPVLRLSPSINNLHGDLKHLADCSRRPGPRKHQKRARLFKRIEQNLSHEIDESFQSRIDLLMPRRAGLKLISDLPLEWIHCNGLPLMLRHECSRIPLTPISASYGIATMIDPQVVSIDQLADVLVVRSFSPHDRIRTILEDCIGHYADIKTDFSVSVRFVDVQTEQELIHAINTHEGAMIVFDCHGVFEAENFIASLVIGEQPINLWSLRGRITRMPPIVLLSACDTAPLDGSHGSAAASMLMLGARTVLGTLLPIDARKAGIFLGRLIYRMREFVPIALRYQKRVTWREVVAGLLQMSYLTEALMSLVQVGRLSRDSYEKLHMGGNLDINQKRADWFERLI